MVKFFQPPEEAQIIAAIQAAEAKTSGEIRVHLEIDSKRPIAKDALRIFRRLRMDMTKERNGILIVLAPDRKEFIIMGDEGINTKVANGFWDQERDLMQNYFRRGDFCQGLVQAISHIGEKLKEFFPYQEDDENELSDEISYGNG